MARDVTECPNCGSMRVRMKRFKMDVSTGKPSEGLLGICVLVGSVTFLASTLLAGSLYFMLLSGLPQQIVITLSLATSLAISSVTTALFFQNRSKVAPLARPAINFYCMQCGHRWSWVEGEPQRQPYVR